MSDFLSNLIVRNLGQAAVQPRLSSLFEFARPEKEVPLNNGGVDVEKNTITTKNETCWAQKTDLALTPTAQKQMENSMELPPFSKPLLQDSAYPEPVLQENDPVHLIPRVVSPVIQKPFLNPRPEMESVDTEKQPYLETGKPVRLANRFETEAPDIEKRLPVAKTRQGFKAFEGTPDIKRGPVTEREKEFSFPRPLQQQGILNGLVQLPRPVNPEKSSDAEPDSFSRNLSSTKIFPGNTRFTMAQPRNVQGLPFNTMRVHETTEPTVHVSIGRVEIRAVPAPPQLTRQSSKPKVMPLEDYLQQRSKR